MVLAFALCDIGQCRAAAPVNISASAHSLASNKICHDGNMKGLYLIIAAIEKMPYLTSLKCASSKVPLCHRSVGRATLGSWHTILWHTILPQYLLLCLQLGAQLSHR